MAETQKAKIQRLEQEKQELLDLLREQNDRFNALQDELNHSFEGSPEYQQLQRDLTTQTEAAKTYKRQLEKTNEIRFQQAAKLREFQKLINENQLKNPRGAGRKPKLSEQEKQRIIQIYQNGNGMSMKAIALQMNCSVGLVYNTIHSGEK